MAGIVSSLTTVYSTNAICNICKLENGSWILDSNAGDHMSSDIGALHELRLLNNPVFVSLPNGEKVQVTHFEKLKCMINLCCIMFY